MADDAERERLEGLFTAHRIFELRRNPVRGTFDAAHLREINRRIFQDMPAAGFPDVTPGQYRNPVQRGMDWIKPRTLEGHDVTSFVAYSSMDEAARQAVENALADTDPARLSRLETAAFTKAIAELYIRLDYLHPFPDGNSRTLRAFTEQLALAAGYALDWSRFAGSRDGRNVLYVARDLSVNRMAMSCIKNDVTRQRVTLTLDQLEGNRDMSDLLQDAVRPLRAIAFERLPESEALKQFPELADAFSAMRKAVDHGAGKFPRDAAGQQQFQESVRAAIIERLDAGEVAHFQRVP